ncbi:MAG: hypothetical protein V4795_02150 [Pseudomonadota bacterium]
MATTRKTTTASRNRAPLPPSGGVHLPAAAAGGPLTTAAGVGAAGSDTTLLDVADTVAGKLDAIAPTFGEILKSVGSGVARAQRALDESVRDTVKKLSDTKIDVITDVITRIDDDTGLPLAPQEEDLIKQNLSVLNFITPSVHEWKYVAVSMDMSVGGMDSKTGMTFSNASFKTSRESKGLFFGFVGVGKTTASAEFNAVRSNIEREAEWASGRVQLDAMLGPRRTTKFPVPATVEIGPQIFIVQGRTTDVKSGVGASAVLIERQVEVTITLLKANGEANAAKNPAIEAPGLLREAVAGGATDADGKVVYKLRRFYPNGAAPFATFPITVRLGAIVRRFSVDL